MARDSTAHGCLLAARRSPLGKCRSLDPLRSLGMTGDAPLAWDDMRCPHPSFPRSPISSLQLDLRPQLAHPIRRDLEVLRRAARVAREKPEQALAPDRHSRPARREERLAAEEEGR